MADNDQSIFTLRYNQITEQLEGFGGGTPQWTPLDLSGQDTGMTQLTGDVTAGPGSGSQVATIADGVVTAAKIDSEAATVGQVLTADGAGAATWEDGSTAAAAGPAGAIQLSDGAGVFTYDPMLHWRDVDNTLRVGVDAEGAAISITATNGGYLYWADEAVTSSFQRIQGGATGDFLIRQQVVGEDIRLQTDTAGDLIILDSGSNTLAFNGTTLTSSVSGLHVATVDGTFEVDGRVDGYGEIALRADGGYIGMKGNDGHYIGRFNWNDNAYLSLTTKQNIPLLLKVNEDGPNYTWTFDENGILHLPPVTTNLVTTGDLDMTADGGAYITTDTDTNAYLWEFDPDGTTKMPGHTTITTTGNSQGLHIVNTTANAVLSIESAETNGGVRMWKTGQQGSQEWVFFGQYDPPECFTILNNAVGTNQPAFRINSDNTLKLVGDAYELSPTTLTLPNNPTISNTGSLTLSAADTVIVTAPGGGLLVDDFNVYTSGGDMIVETVDTANLVIQSQADLTINSQNGALDITAPGQPITIDNPSQGSSITIPNDGTLQVTAGGGDLTLTATNSAANIVATGSNEIRFVSNGLTTYVKPSGGFQFAQITSDPSSPTAGEVWYRDDLSQWRGFNGTITVIFDTTPA